MLRVRRIFAPCVAMLSFFMENKSFCKAVRGLYEEALLGRAKRSSEQDLNPCRCDYKARAQPLQPLRITQVKV